MYVYSILCFIRPFIGRVRNAPIAALVFRNKKSKESRSACMAKGKTQDKRQARPFLRGAQAYRTTEKMFSLFDAVEL